MGWLSLPRDVAIVAALYGLACLWLLLPLIPAILIYRLFPNTFVTASGPLSSLTVKAGGAFAAYLIVLLISVPLMWDFGKDIHGLEKPVWTVSGNAEFYNKNSNKVISKSLLTDMILVSIPERFEHETSSVIFKVPERSDGHFPKLLLKIDKNLLYWTSENISLDEELADKKNEIDYFNKFITIHHPIKISEIPNPGNYDPRTGFQNGLGESISQAK